MSRLYFVRHGESEANVLGVISNRGSVHSLTEKGRRQAEAVALDLEAAGMKGLYASPLLRAIETAEIMSGVLDVEYEVTDALREFDCGIAEGRSDPAAWALHREVMEAWLRHGQLDARIAQGESFVDIQSRFVPLVKSLAEAQRDAEPVVLVGHGGLYQCMLPLVIENLEYGTDLAFPNAGYVLAEARSDGLFGLEWCGKPVSRFG